MLWVTFRASSQHPSGLLCMGCRLPFFWTMPSISVMVLHITYIHTWFSLFESAVYRIFDFSVLLSSLTSASLFWLLNCCITLLYYRCCNNHCSEHSNIIHSFLSTVHSTQSYSFSVQLFDVMHSTLFYYFSTSFLFFQVNKLLRM